MFEAGRPILENVLSNLLLRAGAARAVSSSSRWVKSLLSPSRFMHMNNIPLSFHFSELKSSSSLSLSYVRQSSPLLYVSSLYSLHYVHVFLILNDGAFFSFCTKQIVEEEKYDRRKSTAARSDRFNRAKTSLGLQQYYGRTAATLRC